MAQATEWSRGGGGLAISYRIDDPAHLDRSYASKSRGAQPTQSAYHDEHKTYNVSYSTPSKALSPPQEEDFYDKYEDVYSSYADSPGTQATEREPWDERGKHEFFGGGGRGASLEGTGWRADGEQYYGADSKGRPPQSKSQPSTRPVQQPAPLNSQYLPIRHRQSSSDSAPSSGSYPHTPPAAAPHRRCDAKEQQRTPANDNAKKVAAMEAILAANESMVPNTQSKPSKPVTKKPIPLSASSTKPSAPVPRLAKKRSGPILAGVKVTPFKAASLPSTPTTPVSPIRTSRAKSVSLGLGWGSKQKKVPTISVPILPDGFVESLKMDTFEIRPGVKGPLPPMLAQSNSYDEPPLRRLSPPRNPSPPPLPAKVASPRKAQIPASERKDCYPSLQIQDPAYDGGNSYHSDFQLPVQTSDRRYSVDSDASNYGSPPPAAPTFQAAPASPQYGRQYAESPLVSRHANKKVHGSPLKSAHYASKKAKKPSKAKEVTFSPEEPVYVQPVYEQPVYEHVFETNVNIMTPLSQSQAPINFNVTVEAPQEERDADGAAGPVGFRNPWNDGTAKIETDASSFLNFNRRQSEVQEFSPAQTEERPFFKPLRLVTSETPTFSSLSPPSQETPQPPSIQFLSPRTAKKTGKAARFDDADPRNSYYSPSVAGDVVWEAREFGEAGIDPALNGFRNPFGGGGGGLGGGWIPGMPGR